MARMPGNHSAQLEEAIRRRAKELYLQAGGLEGHDAANWHQAEAEILRESAAVGARRAVVVNVQGVVYTGEYESASANGYTAGEWKPGDPVPIRLAGDKLYLRRRNGQELKTTIVKRIG
ncbi:MAG: DUF2934 domain-containing protein [Candidatus Sulfotelmatobacter sp.]|jgi:DUF2934 family protein